MLLNRLYFMINILTGDSAGGNLALVATMKCLELNIKKPDGIFTAYAPLLVEFVPSPSRLLCLTDPLLPFGFMMRCLKAYTNENKKTTKYDFRTEKFDKNKIVELFYI